MNEQQNIPQQEEQVQQNWIELEQAELGAKPDGNYPEALKLEEGKVTEIDVSIEKPWEEWIDSDSGVIKKIIPVMQNNEARTLWLNTRNPVFRQLLEKAAITSKAGSKNFIVKILRTGQQKNTRYTLVE